jgi:hypothetical protein
MILFLNSDLALAGLPAGAGKAALDSSFASDSGLGLAALTSGVVAAAFGLGLGSAALPRAWIRFGFGLGLSFFGNTLGFSLGRIFWNPSLGVLPSQNCSDFLAPELCVKLVDSLDELRRQIGRFLGFSLRLGSGFRLQA